MLKSMGSQRVRCDLVTEQQLGTVRSLVLSSTFQAPGVRLSALYTDVI